MAKVLTKKVIQFEGIDAISSKISKLIRASGYQGADVAKEYKQAIMAGGLILRDEAKSLVPVDTGKLKSAIFAAYGSPKKSDVLVGVNTRIAVRTNGGKTRTYAHVIEYGNSNHPPQPFMRPAVSASRPVVARVIKEGLLGALDKLTARL